MLTNVLILFPLLFGFFEQSRYEKQVIEKHPDIDEQEPGVEIFFIQFFHGWIEDDRLCQEANAEYNQRPLPVEEQQGEHQQRIKKKMGKGIQAQQEFVRWLVIFSGAVMAVLLAQPLAPALGGFTQGKRFRVNVDLCIMPGGCHVDEQVVVAAGYMVMRCKSFVAEEYRFL